MHPVAELLAIAEATLEQVDYGFLTITAAPDGPDTRLVERPAVDDGLGVCSERARDRARHVRSATAPRRRLLPEDRANFA